MPGKPETIVNLGTQSTSGVAHAVHLENMMVAVATLADVNLEDFDQLLLGGRRRARESNSGIEANSLEKGAHSMHNLETVRSA